MRLSDRWFKSNRQTGTGSSDARTSGGPEQPFEPLSGSPAKPASPELTRTATDREGLPGAADHRPTGPATDKPGSIQVVKARLEASRRLFSAHRYNAAMEEIMAVLDVYPQNRDALDLAGTILYMCSSAHSEERIRPGVANDPLLDSLYSQCIRCHRAWPFNPMFRDFGGQLVITNPVGGRCPACSKVWCRECARSDMHLVCPDCRTNLEIIKEPTGRRRGLGPSKHPSLKLLRVCIFKAPPEPRNTTSYISMVLDALCPEAFHDDAPIQFRTGEQGTDEQSAIMFAMANAMANGIKVNADHTFKETFTDSDGGNGILVSFYEAGH